MQVRIQHSWRTTILKNKSLIPNLLNTLGRGDYHAFFIELGPKLHPELFQITRFCGVKLMPKLLGALNFKGNLQSYWQ